MPHAFARCGGGNIVIDIDSFQRRMNDVTKFETVWMNRKGISV